MKTKSPSTPRNEDDYDTFGHIVGQYAGTLSTLTSYSNQQNNSKQQRIAAENIFNEVMFGTVYSTEYPKYAAISSILIFIADTGLQFIRYNAYSLMETSYASVIIISISSCM